METMAKLPVPSLEDEDIKVYRHFVKLFESDEKAKLLGEEMDLMMARIWELKAGLRKLEWSARSETAYDLDGIMYPCCPACKAVFEHELDCWLAKILGRFNGTRD